jgi:hypothetical protein
MCSMTMNTQKKPCIDNVTSNITSEMIPAVVEETNDCLLQVESDSVAVSSSCKTCCTDRENKIKRQQLQIRQLLRQVN